MAAALKRRPLLSGAIAAVLLFLLAPGSASAAAVRVGHAPRIPAGARPTGAPADQALLHLTVALAPRDPEGLAAYAQGVSTPGSPLFHHYLSVAEFAQTFAPTAQQVAAVQASLRAHGLAPGPVSANGLSLSVAPTVAHAQRAFSIGFRRYTLASGRRAIANTAPPAFDPSVARLVQGVVGLSDVAMLKPLGVASARVIAGGPQPCSTATGTPHAYTADQLASAYGFPNLYAKGDLGAGQTIALYELEPYTQSDINAYQACYGTHTSVSNVPVDGGSSGTQGGEAALDIEDVIGLAPQANILVYSGPNTFAGAFDTFVRAVNDNRARVISSSWGLCEPTIGSETAQMENSLFEEAATQGQSVVAASGDDGAEACTDSFGNLINQRAVLDPASQPFVTGVGGTTLSKVGPPRAETVWNKSNSGASGGGVSSLWPMPSYQSGAPAALHVAGADASGTPCGSATLCREVPDVSADADPATGYAVLFQGNWGAIGGTSASTPLWGALLALTNASPSCAGPPVGFINPALYRAAGKDFAGTFYDVTSGNNAFASAGGFSARAGYDMSTGLGTPDGAALAGWLCFRDRVVNPGNQSSLVGTQASLHLNASSSTGAPLSLTVSGLPPGLSFNPATDNVSGTAVSPGSFTVTVRASDTNGATGATSFAWTVRTASVTLKQPPNQKGTVGKRQSLTLSASVNNGHAPSYSATGLPRGLGVSAQTGTISGAPARAGRYAVTVTARDTTGASASVRFTWTVGHAVRNSRASLTGVGRRAPKLSFSLSSRDRGAIKTISISLPAGLSFSRHPRGITLSGSHTKFKVTLKHGVLTLTLAKAVSWARVSIPSQALHATAGLARKVVGGHAGRLAVLLTTADERRLATRMTMRLRPS